MLQYALLLFIFLISLYIDTFAGKIFGVDNSNINIRWATVQDIPEIMELVRELAIYEKAEHELTVSLEAFKDAGFGPEAIWKAFVAEYENEIVGISLFYPRFSTWKGRKLYLEDIVVKAPWRGKKIGKKLFDATYEYACQNNYHSLFWQVLDWNEPAINFYKKYQVNIDKEWLNVSLTCS